MKLPTRISDEIDAYQNRYRHPDLARFDVSNVFSLLPEHGSSFPEADRWPASWPLGSRPGVYLVFDGTMTLRYVGKAAALGARLSAHFRYESGRGSPCQAVGEWSATPAFLVTVSVHESFEAPSFEEYLIDRLQPPDNRMWIRRPGE